MSCFSMKLLHQNYLRAHKNVRSLDLSSTLQYQRHEAQGLASQRTIRRLKFEIY